MRCQRRGAGIERAHRLGDEFEADDGVVQRIGPAVAAVLVQALAVIENDDSAEYHKDTG